MRLMIVLRAGLTALKIDMFALFDSERDEFSFSSNAV